MAIVPKMPKTHHSAYVTPSGMTSTTRRMPMQVSLTREQIASASRQMLIDAIDQAARKEKE